MEGNTNEAKLGELQDHPVLRGQLQGEVLHSGKIVWLGHNVVLQLKEATQNDKNTRKETLCEINVR